MDGIYKVTTGSWITTPSTEAECLPNDTILDIQIDGATVIRGDVLNIPVITQAAKVPPLALGTTAYLSGVYGLADGFYIVAEDPNDDFDPGINELPTILP